MKRSNYCRAELDNLVPEGTRDEITAQVFENANETQKPTAEEDRARRIPVDQRSPEERQLAQKAQDKIVGLNQDMFLEIADKAPPENAAEAKQVASKNLPAVQDDVILRPATVKS